MPGVCSMHPLDCGTMAGMTGDMQNPQALGTEEVVIPRRAVQSFGSWFRFGDDSDTSEAESTTLNQIIGSVRLSELILTY